ncbi:LysR family transcriptional regulator [Falsiroseomonas sp.]|uniref:LysR family transcriptional regulator n=1 Tax=Falsiroseomonas sp. TaxID=2870721 RepID=UPI0035632177
MPLDLRKIRYFVAVYEEGSLSRAAAREKVVQPALSVQLRQLEAELSVRLFDRSAQGVQPTPAGHHLYTLSSGILRDLEGMRREMLDFGGTIAGTIRVGLMPSICRGPIAGLLDGYLDAYPRVEVKILEAYSGTLARLVIDGELDLAVCNRPAPQTSLKLRLLLRDRIVLASGPASRGLRPGEPCRLADLTDLKLILPSGQHSLRRVLDRHVKSGQIAPARVMEVDGLGATLRLVEATGWATLLPSIAVAEEARAGRFLLNPVAEPSNLTSDIYALHVPERPPSLAAQRFIEVVEQELLRTAGSLAGV